MIQFELPLVERLLDVSAKRHQSLSANIANVDTPGYRATDFTFEGELSSASAIELKVTDKAHVTLPAGSGARRYEAGSTVKANGNDVNLERELTEVTKNAMQYITLVQFLNHKIRTLRSSIQEGNRI
jgi:flagellar basal-body rod protein FlgB